MISSSNCAVTFLPKQTIKVQISEGYHATIGLYDSDGAWLGKINTHYGLDSISGNWMAFSGIIDISDILGLTVYEMMDFFFNKQIENKEEILSKEIHQLTNEIRKASRLMIERRVTNGKS